MNRISAGIGSSRSWIQAAGIGIGDGSTGGIITAGSIMNIIKSDVTQFRSDCSVGSFKIGCKVDGSGASGDETAHSQLGFPLGLRESFNSRFIHSV